MLITCPGTETAVSSKFPLSLGPGPAVPVDDLCHVHLFPSQGILLVYDITNRWSFDGIDRWIKEIDEVGVGFCPSRDGVGPSLFGPCLGILPNCEVQHVNS